MGTQYPPGSVIDFYGPAAYVSLVESISAVTNSLHGPKNVLVLGISDDIYDFIQRVKKAGGDETRLISLPPSENKKCGTVEFSLSNAPQAKAIAKLVRDGSSNVMPGELANIVTIGQELHEQFLPMLMDMCPDLTVWAKGTWGHGDPGVKVRSLLPEGVDVAAASPDGEAIGKIPDNAMYGKLFLMAKSLDCPMGFAYPALLACAAGQGIEASGNVRPSLYVGLIGDVGTGKSVARDRASTMLPPKDGHLVVKTPASDRGLFNIFKDTDEPGKRGESFLLSLDEMRNMLAKAGIESSTLASVLCELFNQNEAGSADKTGSRGVNLKLSILGCVKIGHPSEFPGVFDFNTAQGLYDRMIFGLRDGEDWQYRDRQVVPGQLKYSRPTVSDDIYEAIAEWRSRAPEGRARLGELVLRVAYITAAANGEDHVGPKPLMAAMALVEWQEKIRAVFQPGKAANLMQECVETIETVFKKRPGKSGNWRDVSRDNHWHRRFPSVLGQARKLLESQNLLVYHRPSKRHFWNDSKEEKVEESNNEQE